MSEPSYALVTPARDEAEHLPRLAEAVAAQTVAPTLWVVVDDGSTDGTRAFVEQLAGDSKLIRMIVAARDARSEWNAVPSGRRSGRDVIAFQAGVESPGALPDLVVKLDADISFECDFFERVLEQFARDPRLGIASGTCFERVNGAWTQRHVTEAHVWGATQVYRRECLDAVFPLELRLGWDGIDLLRAELAGWRTRTLIDVPFRHHRLEGVREGSRASSWLAEGWCAWYMGYRPMYLVARAVHHARREPSALALIVGYLHSAMTREERYADPAVRAILRFSAGSSAFARFLGARARPAVATSCFGLGLLNGHISTRLPRAGPGWGCSMVAVDRPHNPPTSLSVTACS